MKRDLELAERTYEEALKADPFHSNSLYNFGVFLETFRDDTKRAAECYDRAVKCDESHALARQALAGLLEQSNPDRARDLYEESLKLLGNEDALVLADFGMCIHFVYSFPLRISLEENHTQNQLVPRTQTHAT